VTKSQADTARLDWLETFGWSIATDGRRWQVRACDSDRSWPTDGRTLRAAIDVAMDVMARQDVEPIYQGAKAPGNP
jgi:hypothetical protein